MKGISLGDSIFLSYQDSYGSFQNQPKTLWILPDGRQAKIDLTALDKKIISGITNSTDSTYYYFLEEIRKTVVLKALVFNNNNTGGFMLDRQLEMRGNLLGSYVDGDLFLLCAEKKRIMR